MQNDYLSKNWIDVKDASDLHFWIVFGRKRWYKACRIIDWDVLYYDTPQGIWLEDNVEGRYYLEFGVIWFSNKSDAVLFELTWG